MSRLRLIRYLDTQLNNQPRRSCQIESILEYQRHNSLAYQFFGLYLEKLIITDALFSSEIELGYLDMEN